MFGKFTTHEFTTKHGTKTTMQLPADVDAWQLYSTRGAGLVASRLTRALVKSFAKLVEVAKATGSIQQGVMAAEAMHSKVRYTDSAADAGAADTEPRCVAQQAIADFARAWTGDRYARFFNCF